MSPAPLDVYRVALRARLCAERLEVLARAGRIGFPAGAQHAEVTVAAATLALEPHDFVAPTPRDLAAMLARGVPVGSYLAHAIGASTDRQHGHSAPGLFSSRAHGVLPPSQLVSQHLTQATGFAWALKMKKQPGVVLALLGRTAADAGDFHSAVNFAGVTKAPIVFLVKSSDPAPAPDVDVADKAVAYGVTSAQTTGGQVEVGAAVARAVERARSGAGPTLLEVRAPSGDPLAELRVALLAAGTLTEESEMTLRREIMAELETEANAAIAAGPPDRHALFVEVFAEVPGHLRDQESALGATHGEVTA